MSIPLQSLSPAAFAPYVGGMDAILILGAAVWADGPSPALRLRTAHAAALWHELRPPQVVCCGGLGLNPPSEAEAMAELLVAAGVPRGVIALEDRSTTTLENIRFSLPLLGGPRVTIVTHRYHAARARMVARHFGLQAEVSSPADARLNLKTRVREVLARPAYAVKLARLKRER